MRAGWGKPGGDQDEVDGTKNGALLPSLEQTANQYQQMDPYAHN